MALKSGSIAGLTQLRDTTTVAYQNQLDQIAGGLVSAFSESDQTGGSAPTIPGLFTYSGAPAMPTTGQTGLAASIAVSANVDPSQGGTLTRLRDGGIGDPGNSAYVANTTGRGELCQPHRRADRSLGTAAKLRRGFGRHRAGLACRLCRPRRSAGSRPRGRAPPIRRPASAAVATQTSSALEARRASTSTNSSR